MRLAPPSPRDPASRFGRANSAPSYRYCLPTGEPVPSVTEILRDVGLSDAFANIPKEVLENKGRIGTTVHSVIADTLASGYRHRIFPNERVANYFRSWSEWFFTEDAFDVIACEVSTIPDATYAGTFDCLARRRFDGRWILYDWKTRAPKWYDGFQLAAYLYLAAVNPAVPYGPADLARTERRIVSLNERRPGRSKLYADPSDFEVWLSAVRVWHARKAA